MHVEMVELLMTRHLAWFLVRQLDLIAWDQAEILLMKLYLCFPLQHLFAWSVHTGISLNQRLCMSPSTVNLICLWISNAGEICLAMNIGKEKTSGTLYGDNKREEGPWDVIVDVRNDFPGQARTWPKWDCIVEFTWDDPNAWLVSWSDRLWVLWEWMEGCSLEDRVGGKIDMSWEIVVFRVFPVSKVFWPSLHSHCTFYFHAFSTFTHPLFYLSELLSWISHFEKNLFGIRGTLSAPGKSRRTSCGDALFPNLTKTDLVSPVSGTEIQHQFFLGLRTKGWGICD